MSNHQENQNMEEAHLSILRCTKCGGQLEVDLPVEPLYDMKLVASIIPCNYSTLRGWVCRNRDRVDSAGELAKPAYLRWR